MEGFGNRIGRLAIPIGFAVPQAETLNGAIAAFLDSFPERGEPLRQLEARGFRLDLFVGVFWASTGGFVLSSEVLSRVGALGLDLDFDLYCLPE
jgi:hypothetical protein